VALPTDFPDVPFAARRISASGAPRLSTHLLPSFAHSPPRLSENDTDLGPPAPEPSDDAGMLSSDEDDAPPDGRARALPPGGVFGPRPLSRDPEMEAHIAAQRAAEAQLGALDADLIARLSGPLRRVTLRPASAMPSVEAAAAARGGGAAAGASAAALWGWGGTAEDGDDDDDDDDGHPSSAVAAAAAAAAARSRAGKPTGPVRYATLPRSSAQQRWEERDAGAGAAPAPTSSPVLHRRATGAGAAPSGGGMARTAARIAAAHGAAAAAAAAAASPGGGAGNPSMQRAASSVVLRPSTASAALSGRARTADAASFSLVGTSAAGSGVSSPRPPLSPLSAASRARGAGAARPRGNTPLSGVRASGGIGE
jgi:hypothetical protein